MEELVSVIVPIYKVEAYMDKCITSIVEQTYENLEIILVDDGSPDACPSLCDEWEKKDSRIRVIHKTNGGLSDARNTGISAARGEYIIFVDSDDYIAPQMIAKMKAAIKLNDTTMCICNILCVNSTGKETGESDGSPVCNEVLDAKEILARFYKSHGWFYIVAWNRMYHRSLLCDDIFPVGKWHEDEFTAAQLIWKAEKISCISYYGYFYLKQRENSIMQSTQNDKHLDAYFALIERYKFYQNIGCDDLLYETQARVYEVLKEYLQNISKYDEIYKEKIEMLFCQYENLTGMPLKDKVKRGILMYNLKLKQLIGESL